MRDDRDVAIVTLLSIAFTGVTILFLRLAEPTGGVIELLFPRVGGRTWSRERQRQPASPKARQRGGSVWSCAI